MGRWFFKKREHPQLPQQQQTAKVEKKKNQRKETKPRSSLLKKWELRIPRFRKTNQNPKFTNYPSGILIALGGLKVITGGAMNGWCGSRKETVRFLALWKGIRGVHRRRDPQKLWGSDQTVDRGCGFWRQKGFNGKKKVDFVGLWIVEDDDADVFRVPRIFLSFSQRERCGFAFASPSLILLNLTASG